MAEYATLLRDQVTLACRWIDRIFLQGYVPKLQSVGWCAGFCAGSAGLRSCLPPGRVGMAGGAGRDRAGAGVGVALVKAKGHQHAAHPQMEWGRQMAFVNHL